jgi:DNA-binding MarR family transcriptional regulator
VEAAIREAGGTDVHETHLAVFSYPPPDGVRPSELARRLNMSRQATNHVIAQLEALGYLERRATKGSNRRLVYLKPRAWRVAEAIWAGMRDLQAEWAAEVGHERFAVFMDVLRELAAPPAHEPRAGPMPE